MSTFKEADITVKVALLPQDLGDIATAIDKKLKAMLFVWSYELQSVPLYFSETKINQKNQAGKIIAEIPWIHCDVTAKALLFSPAKGNRVEGKVTQVLANLFVV
jgi:hypothetical protein